MFIGKVAAAQRRPGKGRITYKDLAKMTGYSPATITAFMNGYKPSDNVAKALSKVLNIEL